MLAIDWRHSSTRAVAMAHASVGGMRAYASSYASSSSAASVRVGRRRTGAVRRASDDGAGPTTSSASSTGAGASSASASASGSSASASSTRDAFASFERALADASRMSGSSSERGWEKVDDAYVLRPRNGTKATKLVHFTGGAFVGASPQLTYGYFLEQLVERGDVLVIATPVMIGLDHLRVTDEAWHKYERCKRALRETVEGLDDLPVYGVGHSLGSLVQVLMASRYEMKRDGNVLISFNNKPATDAIPLFAEVMVPGLRGLSPVIAAANNSPLRNITRAADAQLRDFAPPIVRELLPILDNLEPVIMEVADGRAEFTPTPAESAKLASKYYAVKRNLLVKFTDDTIDETGAVAATLASAAASEDIELTVRNRKGDHVFPLWRETGVELPDEVLQAAEQSADMFAAFGDALGVTADNSPLGLLRGGFDSLREQAKEARRAPGTDENMALMHALVDDILAWMK